MLRSYHTLREVLLQVICGGLLLVCNVLLPRVHSLELSHLRLQLNVLLGPETQW